MNDEKSYSSENHIQPMHYECIVSVKCVILSYFSFPPRTQTFGDQDETVCTSGKCSGETMHIESENLNNGAAKTVLEDFGLRPKTLMLQVMDPLNRFADSDDVRYVSAKLKYASW
jgi:hypothetical protein